MSEMDLTESEAKLGDFFAEVFEILYAQADINDGLKKIKVPHSGGVLYNYVLENRQNASNIFLRLEQSQGALLSMFRDQKKEDIAITEEDIKEGKISHRLKDIRSKFSEYRQAINLIVRVHNAHGNLCEQLPDSPDVKKIKVDMSGIDERVNGLTNGLVKLVNSFYKEARKFHGIPLETSVSDSAGSNILESGPDQPPADKRPVDGGGKDKVIVFDAKRFGPKRAR